jgi:RHS repeat-associated protein
LHGSGFERKFVGNSFDDESRFYDMGARAYHAGLARFVTPEPQYHGLVGVSPYSYSFNNPLKFKDSDGRNPIVVWGNTIKINTQNAPEGFEKRTQEYLNQLKKDDPNLKKMVEALEKSPEIHEISYREGEALSFSQNDIKEKNNQPTGSFIIFDPYSYSRSDIAHELSHAYDTDQGKTSKESIKSIQGVLIPKREVDAVNVEN